jgi:hypothetical protein
VIATLMRIHNLFITPARRRRGLSLPGMAVRGGITVMVGQKGGEEVGGVGRGR